MTKIPSDEIMESLYTLRIRESAQLKTVLESYHMEIHQKISMTANGEVLTREEATVYVKQLDLFVTVLLLQETPAVLSLGNSAKNMGAGKAVKIHISSKMARKLIALQQTMYHLWFLEYQRVLPQLRLHLPRPPSSSQESTSAN